MSGDWDAGGEARSRWQMVARPRRPVLIPVKAGAPELPRVNCMDSWIEVAKWLAMAVGAVAAIGVLVVGILSWFLNHPD